MKNSAHNFKVIVPIEYHQKMSKVCEIYGFKKGESIDIMACVKFLIDVVASDPRTKDVRLRQLHQKSIEIQAAIRRLTESNAIDGVIKV